MAVNHPIPTTTLSQQSMSKRAQRRHKAKQHKHSLRQQEQIIQSKLNDNDANNDVVDISRSSVSDIDIDMTDVENDPYYQQFKAVLDKFNRTVNSTDADLDVDNTSLPDNGLDDNDDDYNMDDVSTVSRRQLKQQSRLTVAELKQIVAHPELVDLHDVNSPDPQLLLQLKSIGTSVPVPLHWSSKNKFLARKRGYEKQPYVLPQFLADTGIGDVRDAQHEKDGQQTLKQQQRSKMQVKLNRVDIDYQLLYDAFFKYQTKPQLSTFSDVYYEGRETQVNVSRARPGHLSAQLRAAFGMTDQSPPPYLFAMQRNGPPPAYTHLKWPGVNAPIPSGCRWGFGPNEWGKPPVDSFGRPLYGDLFNQHAQESTNTQAQHHALQTIDLSHVWGQVTFDLDDDDAEADVVEMDSGQLQSGVSTGIATESTSGHITPSTLQLRKGGSDTESISQPLYHILQQQNTSVHPDQLFGTSHTYILPSPSSANSVQQTEQQLQARASQAKAAQRGEVSVNLTPEELETLDSATLKRRYDQQLEQQQQRQLHVAVSNTVVHDDDESAHGTKKKQKKQSFKF